MNPDLEGLLIAFSEADDLSPVRLILADALEEAGRLDDAQCCRDDVCDHLIIEGHRLFLFRQSVLAKMILDQGTELPWDLVENSRLEEMTRKPLSYASQTWAEFDPDARVYLDNTLRGPWIFWVARREGDALHRVGPNEQDVAEFLGLSYMTVKADLLGNPDFRFDCRNGVVRVRDGTTTWYCSEREWERSLSFFEGRIFPPGYDIYSTFCHWCDEDPSLESKYKEFDNDQDVP
jgi:hypothetical protein